MKALSPHVRDDIPSTIEVVGTTCFKPDNLIYDVQVMISLEGLDQDDIPLADLQDQYFRRITSLGIDKKEFKEDKLAYLALSYKKKGTLFLFDTTSKETFEQVLSVKTSASGLRSVTASVILSPEKSRELATAAIANARERAQGIAEGQDRKIGKILHIKDHQPGKVHNLHSNSTHLDFDANYEYPYPVTVTFELL